MSFRPLRLTGTAAALTLILAGCGGGEEDRTEEDSPANAIPQPEFEGDDTVRLPVAMVTPDGHSEGAPIGEDGTLEGTDAPGDPVDEDGNELFEADPDQTHQIEIARTGSFGCGDTVSVIQTVPMVTDDPAPTALEYLINDPLYYHGDPAFSNPLSVSETLAVESVETDGDTVTVELSGEASSRDECESWQILTQLETTARVVTGADDSEVLIDGTPLHEELGLPPAETPLEIQEITHN